MHWFVLAEILLVSPKILYFPKILQQILKQFTIMFTCKPDVVKVTVKCVYSSHWGQIQLDSKEWALLIVLVSVSCPCLSMTAVVAQQPSQPDTSSSTQRQICNSPTHPYREIKNEVNNFYEHFLYPLFWKNITWIYCQAYFFKLSAV